MTIGIEKIGLYIPSYYLDMVALAAERGVDPNKFIIGIGQEEMAVPGPNEDIVSMAANAADSILDSEDKQLIDQVIFATESAFDYSKAAATYVHDLLEIQAFAKAYEVKQACYAGTAALLAGRDYIANNPGRKVLVLMADISRYGLASSGEPTQGAGAVAILLSDQAQILALDNHSLAYTSHAHDFWRPTDSEYALVDGHGSTALYQEIFVEIIREYQNRYPNLLEEITSIYFHLPFTKMGQKALGAVKEKLEDRLTSDRVDKWLHRYQASRILGSKIGNTYTASLYISFLSALLFDHELQVGERIAFFSYGSGAVAELFTGRLLPGFEQVVNSDSIKHLFEDRQSVSVAQYEELYLDQVNSSSNRIFSPLKGKRRFYLHQVQDQIRIYGDNKKDK
ncbi:hydroxymethylglutaryl-CoA synthase [Hutsoniella sourekii]|uniref:hydroxymethylglutaryl-CoA synthase n=1 Tax=Hutsoniella sourekii TaxID=87650 RepID=UPI00048477FD|nr:hydroxymethylglutaryl-CoA synthase [Hutsoniella sourekii]